MHRRADPREHPQQSADRQPDHLQRETVGDDPHGSDLPGPGERLQSNLELSGDHRLRERDLQPGPQGGVHHQRNRRALGSRPRTQGPSVRGFRRLPLGASLGDRRPSRRIHDQPRCGRRPVCLPRLSGQLRLGGPGPLSQQLQDRHLRDHLADADRAAGRGHLLRRTEAGRSVSPVHGRLRLRDQCQARRFGAARPGDRSADRRVRRSAAGPLRSVPVASLRLGSRPDGHADRVHDLRSRWRFLPMERRPCRPAFQPELRPRLRPAWRSLPRSHPALQAGARRGHLQPGRRRLQLVHAETRP